MEISKTTYPSAYDDVIGVCKLKGKQSRVALRQITTKLFGMFGHEIHAAFITQ